MKFTDNMSVPPWKLALQRKKQRKRDEEKRKQQEEEERRLAALPPWKRHAEQPKTVIFIDKNNVANQVDLSGSSDSSKQNNNSKSSATKQTTPLVNGSVGTGTAPNVSSGGESLDGKVGGDETDSGPSGVSEEHCTPVQDNPFLKLERTKRRAPPPPSSGNQINVIASNGPGGVSVVDKSKSSKKLLASDSTKSNHIQQSSSGKSNGPSSSTSSVGNQLQSSTKLSPHSEQKTVVQDNVPKAKTKSQAPSKVVSNSTTSSSKDTPRIAATKVTEPPKSAGSIIQMKSGPTSPSHRHDRRTSISELRNLFGSPVSGGNAKVQSSNQAVPKSPNHSSGSSGLSDDKSNKSQIVSSNAKVLSPAKQSSSTASSQKQTTSAEKSSLVKIKEKGKDDINSKSSNGGKSLPDAGKDAPLRPKPSTDLSASAIISLTNDGPLRKREKQMVRSSSVIDDEDEVELSLESPRSPSRGRLNRDENAKDPEKRRAPSTPRQVNGQVNGSTTGATDVKGASKVEKSKTETPTSSGDKRVEEIQNDISYPKNFRDPNYMPPQKKAEEIPYPSDFRKPPTEDKSLTSVKSTPRVSDSGDVKKTSLAQPETKKTDQTANNNVTSKLSNATNIKVSEQTTEKAKKKVEDKPKESSPAKTSESSIPYPDDFRRYGNKSSDTDSKQKAVKKDIVKPSELAKSSSNSDATDSKKTQSDDSGGGKANIFGGFKLRATKPKEQSGINLIAENKIKPKQVDNAPKGSASMLIAVGSGGSNAPTEKKKNVKKFEKVDMIGYNSPSGKPSALKKTGKSPTKRHIQFDTKEEETFEYLSEEASIEEYDETHQEEEKAVVTKKKISPAKNGMNNGIMDDGSDDDDASNLKSNTSIRTSGFQNFAASSSLSMTDLLMGRGRPEEPREPPKPTPSPEPEPTSNSLTPMDGDYFSSAGTAALLF